MNDIIFAILIVLLGGPLLLLSACGIFPLLVMLVKSEVELVKVTWKWIKDIWKSE